jgi:hypothetical protein
VSYNASLVKNFMYSTTNSIASFRIKINFPKFKNSLKLLPISFRSQSHERELQRQRCKNLQCQESSLVRFEKNSATLKKRSLPQR